jgi:cellulose synthase/poly-beta-1,6-N-acetylglucosamine synthase-like glycosyltransferase
MPLRNLLQDIVIATTVLFAGFYACYAGLCYGYLKRKKRFSVAPIDPQDAPTVSIIVPTYNEESVVARRIENFKTLNYPQDKLQVMFVDGGSTDSTRDMIERMKGDDVNLLLVQQTRREGYNKAIMDGFRVASGSILSITGAETEFDSNALLQLVKHFSRPDVGAVTGRMITRNQQVFSGKLEKAYRDLYDFMRQGETLMDSCFDVKGELNAARREIVEKILEKPNIATRGSVDTCFSFQSRIMGMKTVFEPEAVYWEDAPSTVRESFQQTIRRGHVHMEAMSLYKDMYFNPRLGIFGLLIAPAHLAMVVLLPLVFGLGVFSLASLFVIEPGNPLASILILLALALLILSRRAQAFAKIQLSLIGAIGHSLLRLKPFSTGHTRLPSTRPTKEREE